MSIPITNPTELREILSLAIDKRLLSSGRLPVHDKALRARMIAERNANKKLKARLPKGAGLAATLSQLSAEQKLALAIELGLTS